VHKKLSINITKITVPYDPQKKLGTNNVNLHLKTVEQMLHWLRCPRDKLGIGDFATATDQHMIHETDAYMAFACKTHTHAQFISDQVDCIKVLCPTKDRNRSFLQRSSEPIS